MKKPLKIGDIAKIYMANTGMTQAQLGRNVGCTKGMINAILSGQELPGHMLAWRIAKELCDTEDEQETVAFYLLGCDKALDKIESDFPHAFKSYRATGDG